MGLFDKLFIQEETPKETVEGGGTRELLEAQAAVPNYDEKVNISGSAAEEILNNALKPLGEKQTTIYTLQSLISTMPTGTKKESIIGVLNVTKISVEEIKKDAQERLDIIDSAEKKLEEKVKSDIEQFETEIKNAEDCIEANRRKKAEAEALLREFQLLGSKTADEIKNIISTIE